MSESGAGTVQVLHVKASIDRRMGGSATATANAAEGTHLAGDTSSLIATKQDNEDLSLLATLPNAVTVHLVPRTWPGRFGFSLPLWRWLHKHICEFDLVVVHELFSFAAAAAAYWSWRLKVPYAFRPHGSLDPYDLRKHWWAKRMISPLLRQLLQHSAGLWLTAQRESERVTVFGADVRRYVSMLPVPAGSQAGDRDRFRFTWQIPDDDFVLLFLGRIDPKKGLPRTIRAFESAEFKRAAWLVIAGTGESEYEAHIRKLAMNSPAHGRIKFVGFLGGADRADAFAGSDLFVLHSDNENFGLAPVEALHERLPSVLSDEVYVSSELVASGTAVVVHVEDMNTLITTLEALSEPGNEQLAAMRGAALAATLQFEPQRVAIRDHEIVMSMIESAQRKDDERF